MSRTQLKFKGGKKIDMPKEFSEDTIRTINRIEEHINVLGVLCFKDAQPMMYTVPRTEETVLTKQLPPFNELVRRALTELDVLDELIAYRIITKTTELMVAGDKEFTAKLKYFIRYIMKIITNLLKDTRDEWLVRTTATINAANPIVDRIMDDDSVEGVIMTNKEGAPILTNVSVTSATNYGRALHKFGMMSQMYVKELNPMEEIMIIRIHTKKNEIMVAPETEFSIIVIQHARARHKVKDKKGKEK